MSEMATEGGGGGFASKKVLGVPLPILIIGGVVLAYFVFFRKSGANAASTGTSTTGNTTIKESGPTINLQKPVVGSTGTPNPQPKPPTRIRTVRVTSHLLDIWSVSKHYGLSESQFLKLNPKLKRLEGTRKPIPIGTKIKV